MHIRTLCALLLVSLLCPLAAPAEKAGDEIVLSFAGDCTLGAMNEYQNYSAGFVQVISAKGLDYPFSGVAPIFEADDFTLVNLEGTFTDRTKGQDKPFIFRGPPAFAQILPLGSVEAVNIANNHIMDFFEEGKQDTLSALTAHGILYAGNGETAVADVPGVRVGLCGYSYPHRTTLEKLKTHDLPALRAAGCDLIIFSMHAGTEEDYTVTLTQREIARGAIDLGVDIVVGHHPHVLHGVEVYAGKPIFYSLGNFAFGGNVNPKDWDTLIGQVALEKTEEGVRLTEMRLIPCRISGVPSGYSDYRPVPATPEQAEAILRKISWTSPTLDAAVVQSGVVPLDN